MKEDTIPGQEIAEILAQARGRENALTSAEIARRLNTVAAHVSIPRRPRGWDARSVRRFISTLQDQWTFLVCATPGGGFYVPEELDQVRVYYLFLATLEKRAIEKRRRYRANAKRLGYSL